MRVSTRTIPLFVFSFLISFMAHAAPSELTKRLDDLQQKAGFKKGEIGVWVVESGKTLFEQNADKKYIPASISKIPTGAAVLSLLPQGHKFKTVFAADSKNASVGKNGRITGGVLKGSLYLVGGGDPSFVSENMWFLVNELARTGLTEVEGDLVVDDTRFDDIRFGEDRQSVRVDRAYDAPLGAMSLNWNAVTAWVRPGAKAGEPAEVSLDVMSPFLKLENKTKTGSSDKGFAVGVERLASKDRSLICVFAENVWLALFGVWTMAGARGAFLPAVQAIQHEEFPERVRTTGLSVMNFSTEAIFALSYFVSAAVVDAMNIKVAWGISAFCFAVSALIAALGARLRIQSP